jgi:hypothetical protein
MRFKSVDIDRMDGDNPESMSRTSKIQRRVASSLIRPTSASTGEQRQRIRDNDGRIGPDDFSQSIVNDQRVASTRDRRLTEAMQNVEMYDSVMPHAEAKVVKARQDNPREEEWARHSLKSLMSARNQASSIVEQLKTSPQLSQTSKHVWMAALLGKNAVGYSLSDSNPAMRKEAVTLGPNSPDFETPSGPQGIYQASDLGEAKAINRANSRTLNRKQRLKEKISPYRAIVHELGDAYGGREEGGWTYETGKPVHTSRGFVTQRGAAKEADKLRTAYTRKKGGRSILNMSPSDVYSMDEDDGVFKNLEYTDNWADAMGVPSKFMQEPLDEDYNYSHFGQPSKDYRVRVGYGIIGEYPKQRPYYE